MKRARDATASFGEARGPRRQVGDRETKWVGAPSVADLAGY